MTTRGCTTGVTQSRRSFPGRMTGGRPIATRYHRCVHVVPGRPILVNDEMHRQWSWPSVLEQLLLRQPLQQGHAQALMGAWQWEEVGAGADGGVSGGPAVQGAPVSLDLPLPPALQGGGVGHLRHRGDGAGTFMAVTAAACGGSLSPNMATGAASGKVGSADVPEAWRSPRPHQPSASRLWHRDGALFSLRPGMAFCPCRAGPVAAQPGDQKRTVFNLLGSLVNPPKPTDQVLSVADAAGPWGGIGISHGQE